VGPITFRCVRASHGIDGWRTGYLTFAAAALVLRIVVRSRARCGLHGVIMLGGWLAIGMVEADFDDIALPFLGAPLRVSGWLRDQLTQVVRDAPEPS
jgi:hypothetical protein